MTSAAITAGDASTSASWLARDATSVGHSSYAPPLVFERGEACTLWDVDGTRYLDFEAGQFCMNTGHSHPKICAALAQQTEQLMQIGNRFTNRPRILLAERLASMVEYARPTTFFCSTGSEANETALRIAKLITGRYEVVAVGRGYHGRTGTAFSLSSSKPRLRRGYGPPAPGLSFAAAPYSYRCAFGCDSCDATCWRYSTEMLDRATTGEPAAVIVEFIIGAGGVIPVSKAWAEAVRAWCDEHDALLIADEALTGMGRTGRWFAYEHFGLTPDIVVTSKALGGGVPAAAVITSGGVADAALQRGFIQAASHQGDPFQCMAALAAIDVADEEDLLEKARVMGNLLADGLAKIVADFTIAGDARGLGLIQGLEIVHPDGSEAPELASEICVECMDNGLILGGLRPGIREVNVLRLAPPLVVAADEVREALAKLRRAIEVVTGRMDT